MKSYTKLILDVVSWCWFACRQDVWGENLATGHDVTSFRMVLDSKGRAGGQQPDLPGSPTARPTCCRTAAARGEWWTPRKAAEFSHLAKPLIIWADENICVLCTIRHFSGNRKIKAPLAALTDCDGCHALLLCYVQGLREDVWFRMDFINYTLKLDQEILLSLIIRRRQIQTILSMKSLCG